MFSGVAAALFVSASLPAHAASSSGTFEANTNVSSVCTVSNGSFVSPKPVDTLLYYNDIAKYDNKITIKCTKGTTNVQLERDDGLNTTCRQNGLNAQELLMKSANGDFLPYQILMSTPDRSSWACNQKNHPSRNLSFATTDTQEFLFELDIAAYSTEAKRLYNLAREGEYTDTLTFSVTF